MIMVVVVVIGKGSVWCANWLTGQSCTTLTIITTANGGQWTKQTPIWVHAGSGEDGERGAGAAAGQAMQMNRGAII